MEPPQEMLDDFRNHVFACFKYLGLGDPTPAQYGMADALQNGPEDMQLHAGRGFGKSVITSCLASWFLLKDPDCSIMVVSATGNKAIEFISMTRQILNLVPYMQHLIPRDAKQGGIDNAYAFTVGCRSKIGQDKSCFARGVGAQITGSHATYLIYDDVEIEGNCETAEQRQKLLNRVMECEQIRNPGGRIVFLGTPQITDSIYNQLADGYPITKFPAEMPDKNSPFEAENIDPWIWELGLEPGEPTQPERFSKELLLSRQAKVGPTLYALHYKLVTALADAELYPLRLSDLIVMHVPKDVCPEKIVWASSTPMKSMPSFGLAGDLIYEPMWVSPNFVPYQQTVMFVDPSGRGSDETAVCVASFCNGYVFVHELIGLAGGYDKPTLLKIAKKAYEYGVKLIRVESNFGDAMYNQLLSPVVAEVCGQVCIEEYKSWQMKEGRIIKALEPAMSSHRIVMDITAARQEETQKQITRMQDLKGALVHDDRVDVLAATVAYWEDQLHLNVDHAVKKHKAQEREAIVDKWANNFRAGDYMPGCSGALKYQPTPQPKKRNKAVVKHKKRSWR